jgi:Ca2+-binding RTX toxin-like protein
VEGFAVLGLLGLLGAMFAGVAAADIAVTRGSPSGDAPEDDESQTRAEGASGDGAPGSLLEWEPEPAAEAEVILGGSVHADHPELSMDEGVAPEDDPAVSDDLPDEPDPDMDLSGGDGDDVLSGGGGADSVAGGAGNDLLGGRDGADLIEGGSGDDQINGGAGNDSLHGGAGNDGIDGEDGDDLLLGGAGDDRLAGHAGDDSLSGDAGADSLMGGAGRDALDGGDDDDWLTGGFGDDLLAGGFGSDTLDGNDGDDTLWGDDDDEADFLNGGLGDDLLMLGGNDYGTGNEGADIFALGVGNGVAQITDFNPAEDEIMVIYDMAMHPDPVITLEQDEGSSDVTVLLDGMPLALVQGGAGLAAGQIRLSAGLSGQI